MRTDLNFGVGRKILDNITGLGILSGKNVQYGSMEMLVGIFQHFDYWDNRTFELGTIAFGGGVVSKLPLIVNSNLYTNFHLGIVPLAGNSTQIWTGYFSSTETIIMVVDWEESSKALMSLEDGQAPHS